MHLILTGATGLVGSAALDAMIKMKDITKISVISRRPVKMADDAKDPRINVILHSDFNKYDDELLEKLKDASGCVWALGISQNAVSKEEYVKITKDYALAAATAFQTLPAKSGQAAPAPFRFVYVSGEGATFAPGAFTPIFGRVKGETELALAAMRKANPVLQANTVRPSFVDWGGDKAIASYIPAPGAVRNILLGAIRVPMRAGFFNSHWSPTEPLGRFLAEMAAGRFDEAAMVGPGFEKLDGGFTVVDNPGFRKLAGLDK
ncbi:nucleoside-diphosphate-sugar epimerase [Lasiosphaeris hirsuta]|uniref:Nucleoside-diphosphate-sugar epimerase n=1 Tax=Lasiosphaeris hirsuta TaxID=260670 RepID=A0AA40AP37_9PEZI|nr:nucleoside-diphosphate-sugar epimerase [Lasiosphaeris hirsuta]